MPDGPDPMTDRLTRFTPNPAGLDRDALLFAAGRQSVRGSRLWPVLAGLLAVSQAVTLVVLWPGPKPEPVSAPVVPAPPAVRPTPEPPATIPEPSRSPDVWSVGTPLDVVQGGPPPAAAGEFVPPGPVLTVGSVRRFD